MPVKKATNEAIKPQEEQVQPSDTIVVAPNTEYERTVRLRIPRGKKYRNKHRQLLKNFSLLEKMTKGEETSFGVVADAIDKIFSSDKFEDEMVPFVLGMETPEDLEYLDYLTPMEKFTAFMEAASYIVSGGNMPEHQAAIAKSRGGEGGAEAAEE